MPLTLLPLSGISNIVVGNNVTLDLSGSLNSAIAVTGGAGNDTLQGGAGNDFLDGQDNLDIIIGSSDNDTRIGGNGNDDLTGGFGADHFVFNFAPSSTNLDTITDFLTGTDIIELSQSIFGALTGTAPTSLNPTEFSSGNFSTAQDANNYIIYDTSTGALYYDADGDAAGSSAVQIAILTGMPSLASTDFLVIG